MPSKTTTVDEKKRVESDHATLPTVATQQYDKGAFDVAAHISAASASSASTSTSHGGKTHTTGAANNNKTNSSTSSRPPNATTTSAASPERSGSPLRAEASLAPSRTIHDFVSAGAEDLLRRTPANVSNMIKSSVPAIVCVLQALESLVPYLEWAFQRGSVVWSAHIAPYHPEDALPMLLGLVLCFFGGSYLTLIAAVEAFRITGYKRLRRAMTELFEEGKKAYRAAEADEEFCALYQRKEITSTEFLARSASLVARAVDPEKVTDALSAMWAGFIAVVATLKVHFAQAVTLGASIGDTLERHTGPIVGEQVERLLPDEHHRWAPILSSYLFRVVGVTVAWVLHRIITAFHSALRGGQLFASNIALLLKHRGSIELSENTIQYLGLVTAALGYLWQLSNGFSIPFPLNLLLLPVTFLEYLVTWCVHVI